MGTRAGKGGGLKNAARDSVLMRAREAAGITDIRAKVVEARARGISITGAARAAGTTGATVRRWIGADADFARLMEQAELDGRDWLEDQALRFATLGTPRDIYQRGERVGTEMVRDSQLFIALLGGRIEKYRQAKTKVEVTGKDGGAIEVASVRARIAGKLAALAGVAVSKGVK
jgi:hypothetical protein